MGNLKPPVKTGLVGCLMLTFMLSSFASDSDRTAQLEKEVQELKNRLTKLEAVLSTASNQQKNSATSEGFKSLDSWRSLRVGMGPDEVRRILGEPTRVDGGLVAYWVYASRGEVTFVRDQVTQWREPR